MLFKLVEIIARSHLLYSRRYAEPAPLLTCCALCQARGSGAETSCASYNSELKGKKRGKLIGRGGSESLTQGIKGAYEDQDWDKEAASLRGSGNFCIVVRGGREQDRAWGRITYVTVGAVPRHRLDSLNTARGNEFHLLEYARVAGGGMDLEQIEDCYGPTTGANVSIKNKKI